MDGTAICAHMCVFDNASGTDLVAVSSVPGVVRPMSAEDARKEIYHVCEATFQRAVKTLLQKFSSAWDWALHRVGIYGVQEQGNSGDSEIGYLGVRIIKICAYLILYPIAVLLYFTGVPGLITYWEDRHRRALCRMDWWLPISQAQKSVLRGVLCLSDGQMMYHLIAMMFVCGIGLGDILNENQPVVVSSPSGLRAEDLSNIWLQQVAIQNARHFFSRMVEEISQLIMQSPPIDYSEKGGMIRPLSAAVLERFLEKAGGMCHQMIQALREQIGPLESVVRQRVNQKIEAKWVAQIEQQMKQEKEEEEKQAQKRKRQTQQACRKARALLNKQEAALLKELQEELDAVVHFGQCAHNRGGDAHSPARIRKVQLERLSNIDIRLSGMCLGRYGVGVDVSNWPRGLSTGWRPRDRSWNERPFIGRCHAMREKVGVQIDALTPK